MYFFSQVHILVMVHIMHKVKNSSLIDNILDNGFGTLSGVLSSEKSELLSKKCEEILLSDY